MPDIRQMTELDIPFAIGLTDIEQWGNVAADFKRLLDFEPQGCFIAEENNNSVGMICTTRQGESYAFISSLIVTPHARGRKIGETLMAHSLEYLKSRGIETVELDGVFPALSMYRRFGFRDHCLSLRFKRPPTPVSEPTTEQSSCTLRELIEFDEKKTGKNRSKILNRFYSEFRERLFINRDDRLNGYAFTRPIDENQVTIGPVVAIDATKAGRIIHTIVSANTDSTLAIGVLENNRMAVGILLDSGFAYCQPSVRMTFGPRPRFDDSCVYAILSADKG